VTTRIQPALLELTKACRSIGSEITEKNLPRYGRSRVDGLPHPHCQQIGRRHLIRVWGWSAPKL